MNPTTVVLARQCQIKIKTGLEYTSKELHRQPIIVEKRADSNSLFRGTLYAKSEENLPAAVRSRPRILKQKIMISGKCEVESIQIAFAYSLSEIAKTNFICQNEDKKRQIK